MTTAGAKHAAATAGNSRGYAGRIARTGHGRFGGTAALAGSARAIRPVLTVGGAVSEPGQLQAEPARSAAHRDRHAARPRSRPARERRRVSLDSLVNSPHPSCLGQERAAARWRPSSVPCSPAAMYPRACSDQRSPVRSGRWRVRWCSGGLTGWSRYGGRAGSGSGPSRGLVSGDGGGGSRARRYRRRSARLVPRGWRARSRSGGRTAGTAARCIPRRVFRPGGGAGRWGHGRHFHTGDRSRSRRWARC